MQQQHVASLFAACWRQAPAPPNQAPAPDPSLRAANATSRLHRTCRTLVGSALNPRPSLDGRTTPWRLAFIRHYEPTMSTSWTSSARRACESYYTCSLQVHTPKADQASHCEMGASGSTDGGGWQSSSVAISDCFSMCDAPNATEAAGKPRVTKARKAQVCRLPAAGALAKRLLLYLSALLWPGPLASGCAWGCAGGAGSVARRCQPSEGRPRCVPKVHSFCGICSCENREPERGTEGAWRAATMGEVCFC